MKILMVVHTALFPAESGAVKRNLHLLLEAAREHALSLLILGAGHDLQGFRREFGGVADPVMVVDTGNLGWRRALRGIAYILSGKSWFRQWDLKSVQHAIDTLCGEHVPDLVHLSTPFFRMFRFPPGVPVVADAHNVEHDNLRRIARDTRSLFRKAFSLALAWRLRSEEVSCASRCDTILASSERDRDLFLTMAPKTPVTVVPNGVDLSAFIPRGLERGPRSLVFTGVMNYTPNDEAMRKFVRQCFPRLVASVPDVRLTIVGAYPSRAIRNLASDRIRVTGHVPDVRPFLERAEVFVAPLNSGGGTRLKILEAIAMGTPVVSTSIGCEGLRLRDGEHMLVADSPESFVQAVLRLFRDPELRAGLAARALDTVRRLYGWDHAGENLLRAYESFRVPQGRGDRIGVGSRRLIEG